jgi:hypothetical protein
MLRTRTSLIHLLLVGALRALSDGGWQRGRDASLAGPCTIEHRSWRSLSLADFTERFRDSQPVAVTDLPALRELLLLLEKDRLLSEFGEVQVTLSTANTYSYAKRKASLREYVEALAPVSEEQLGNETQYLFGDTPEELAPLLQLYEEARKEMLFLSPADAVALSFGIAAPGTGVPFHVHGAAWSETLYGRKRWLLYPPDRRPSFDPDASTLSWLRAWQAGALQRDAPPLECTVPAGSAIFIPKDWWHAILNVDESCFMSSFVNFGQLSKQELR